MDSVPIVYSFIYYRLKEKNKGCYVHIASVKETIWQVVKNNGGIPRYYTNEIIKDLEKYKLVKRLDNNGRFQILVNKCDGKIKKIECMI